MFLGSYTGQMDDTLSVHTQNRIKRKQPEGTQEAGWQQLSK